MKLLWFTFLLMMLCEIIIGDEWEQNLVMCPKQCVCQYSQLSDLSIARWIVRENDDDVQHESIKIESDETFTRDDDEISFDNIDNVETNAMVKYVMCILQSQTNLKDLIDIIPQDVQALIILHNEIGQNVTVSTGDFRPLLDLITLEIRGGQNQTFRLLFDIPLPFLKYANFESIELVGSEIMERPKNQIHPSESFDYVPSSEKFEYNVSVEVQEEVQILPYDVYIMEIQKMRLPSFYGWDSLSVLRIHNCELSELHWEMFNGLHDLQHLSLEHNKIKIVPAFAFYGALHIKTLSLARNQIFDLNYRSLAGLLDLKTLDLSKNNITKLSELTFPPFPSLEYVDFRSNPIQYILPSTFGVMNATKTMFLGSKVQPLEFVTKYPFEPLKFLTTLEILNTSARTLHQKIFKGLKNLQKLTIKGSIKRIEFDAFAEMRKLQSIDLSDCGICEISMDAFMGCKLLEIVDLSHNNLTSLPTALFDDQIYLTEIYLNNNNLKTLPLDIFRIETLKVLRLTSNPWECSCSMAVWNHKIINQIRGPKTERCIKDFQTAKIISCRILENYKRDVKLSPRCANVRGRTVFYALRKNLRCDFKKHIEQFNKQRNYGHTETNDVHLIELQNRRRRGKLIHPRNSMQHRKDLRKIVTRNKSRKSMGEMNTIPHLSEHNMHYRESHADRVFGPIDSYDSFNHI